MIALVVALALSACDLDPPPSVSNLSPLSIRSLSLDAGTDGVARFPIGSPIRIGVTRLVAPSTANALSVRATSGPFRVYGAVRFDPARDELRLSLNSPDVRPGLRYVLRITSPLQAWDGAPLDRAVELPFVPEQSPPPPRARVPSLRAEVAPLLQRRCGTAACHGGDEPAMGLRLDSAEAITRTAVGVMSSQRGSARGAPDYTDPRWGALLRIDPGDAAGLGRPEYSYLLYKLLGDGPALGARMPPEGPLEQRELELVSDWIAAGAPSD